MSEARRIILDALEGFYYRESVTDDIIFRLSVAGLLFDDEE